MLTVNPETIHDELTGAKKIIEKWLAKLDEGLPAVDQPGDEEALDMLMREFVGELRVCAGKCANVAEVLSGD
jgi:vacuolar-type H+-ATPase subunit E/Vma4